MPRRRLIPPWARWAAAAAVLAAAGRLLPPLEFRQLRADRAFRVLDRGGATLRVVRRDRGFYAPLDYVSPHLIAATLRSEDRRFRWHCGVDPLALARAALQRARAGRVVSGGSTITMQLARIMLGPRPRGAHAKLQEAALALYIEWRLPKAAILEYYLNNAPYGRNLRGCETASLDYFGCRARELTPAQASLLAVIPRNPRLYDPRLGSVRLEAARSRLAAGLRGAGFAAAPPQVRPRPPWEFHAPHFCDWALARAAGPPGDLRTTLDAALTGELELHVRAYVHKLSGCGITNAAVVVIDNRDVSVAALVGSAGYFNPAISGQCNGAASPRQPGSALKPFTYGLALERGLPASYLLPDLDAVEGAPSEKFLPRNYDERCHGPVRMRTALGCSYNVAAVRALELTGTAELLERLRSAGFAGLRRGPQHYGPGLTLGNGEVTLVELARAYAALARGGVYRPERFLADTPEPESARVFSPQVAYLLAHIMADRSARAPAFGECSPIDLPFPCAAKTGTTKDYKDNWTVGFTTDYTVGVWVGNFDGTPMHGVSGVSGAGPLFRDVMLALHRGRRPAAFARPGGLEAVRVCPLSGDPVSPHCPDAMTEYFLAGAARPGPCAFHGPGRAITVPPQYGDWARRRDPAAYESAPRGELRVMFPSEADVFRIDPGRDAAAQAIRLRAAVPGGAAGLRWMLDGREYSRDASPSWRLAPGEHVLYVAATVAGRPVRSRPVRFLVQS